MKTLKFIVLALFPLTTLAGGDIGFTAGNELLSTYIEGEISVSCQDGMNSDFANFRCVADLLEPAEYSKFRGPMGIDADEVVLKATREDGSTREKSEGYDSSTGLSKGSFNLWISTLLQRPLLKLGKNEVEFTLKKEGTAVTSGAFTANVAQAPDRTCHRRGHYFSRDLNDCRFGHNVCDRYFYEQNYCK